MKLRLLNGSHSTLAYLGFLAGYDFIWQASGDPLLATLIERLMVDEVMPTLSAPPGVELAAYGAQIRERFRNPALPHRTQPDRHGRIAEAAAAAPRHRARAARWRRVDRASRARDRRVDSLRDAAPTSEGNPIVVADPMAAKFAAIAAAAGGNASQIADGFLDLVEVFGADLSANADVPARGEPRRRRPVPRRRPPDARGAHRATSLVGRNHGRIAARPASRPAVPGRSRHPRSCARALRHGRAICRS